MLEIGRFLERVGVRLRNAGYLLRHRNYAEVRRRGGARDLFQLLNREWARSRGVELVIDVGANEGQFLTAAEALFPRARKVAFEPNPAMVTRLRAQFPDLVIHGCACGATKGRATLNVTQFAPSASLLEGTTRNRELYAGTVVRERIEVEVESLDSFGDLRGPRGLLKLDVQGVELEVLRGAPKTLGSMEVVVCEIGLERLYEGQAELEDIVGFLRQHRFRVVDFAEPIRNESEEVVYFDLAFARERN